MVNITVPGMICLAIILLLPGCASQQSGSSPLQEAEGSSWLVKMDGGICRDRFTGLMWQRSRSDQFVSFQEAAQYAESLNLGGFADWRLPTTAELLRLHQIFESEREGDCKMNRKGNYWAFSPDQEESVGYWETYWLCSPEYAFRKALDSQGAVRAVRP